MLWYADLRGFTRISDVTSGAQIVEMLNEIFEMLTASLRTRGGHVLKFIGDAMLATISFEEAEERVACNRGLEAAMESFACRAHEQETFRRRCHANQIGRREEYPTKFWNGVKSSSHRVLEWD